MKGSTRRPWAQLYFLAQIANALSHFGAAWLGKHIGLVNTMVFTHIPSSVLLVTVAIAPSFWVAAALLLMCEGLVEMDVPARQSYLMAVVKPEERTFASGVTGIVRMAGWAIAAGFSGLLLRTFELWTLLIVGAAMKIGYDLALWYSFRHIKAAGRGTSIMSTQPSSPPAPTATRASLGDLVRYFLYLGTLGFGGPVALVGFMHRDLVERRRWIDEGEYRLGVALAEIMPGPLAAQLAIALGYFQRGVLGATAVGLAFVVPSFLMVIGISVAYQRFGGLWWMQALFYGIGAAVIAIIAIAAFKLARSTNKRDPLLWAVFGALAIATMWAEAELAEFFVIAGLVTLLARARPTRLQALTAGLGGRPWSP